MSAIRVLLADDHTLVRAGIRSLLQKLQDVEVVAEAENGREALSLIGEHQPDIALVDIAMSELNGLDVAERVKRNWPHVRVVMLSMHANEEYVLQALRAGAAGYLLKDSALEELGLAVKAVMRGETYLSPTISRHVVDDYLRRIEGIAKQEEKGPFVQLTTRQREILQLIAEGNTTKEIALKLSVSVKTVETHRARLMERLGIHDVAGLVRYAVRVGLVNSQS
jgi:DNA-binding NarL/FixJ family response regulator